MHITSRSFMKIGILAKFLVCILLITAFTIFLWQGNLKNYLTLEYIQHHQEIIKNLINDHYSKACLIYIVLYATIVVCMLSCTLILTTYAGFLFGFIPGTVLSITGALVGCTLSFLAIRYLFHHWLTNRYHNALEKFSKKFKEHGVLYLLTLYFFPLTPYALITTLAALSDISLITFLWTTAVGIFPITTLCSFAGRKVATLSSIKDIVSLPMLLALITLSLLAIVPTLLKIEKKVTTK